MPPCSHAPQRCRSLACAFTPSRLSTHQLRHAYQLLVPVVRCRLTEPAAAPTTSRSHGGVPCPPLDRLRGNVR
jgi:hypothetical protein